MKNIDLQNVILNAIEKALLYIDKEYIFCSYEDEKVAVYFESVSKEKLLSDLRKHQNKIIELILEKREFVEEEGNFYIESRKLYKTKNIWIVAIQDGRSYLEVVANYTKNKGGKNG